MKRVIVIGCPGAGKSTFAKNLRDATGLPLYHLDMLWHRPDRTNVSVAEFDEKLGEILGRPEWIIDGNYERTQETRLQQCDTAFLLDYPLEICLDGAKDRIGKGRDDMPWVETELDEKFRQWILNFPKSQLPRIYDLLSKYQSNREIVIFKSREGAEEYLKGLLMK